MKDYIKIILAMLVGINLISCTTLPTGFVAELSHVLTNTNNTALGFKAKVILGGRPDKTALLLSSERTDAFLTRMVLLSLAERSINVQYFIWKSDIIGNMLFDRSM